MLRYCCKPTVALRVLFEEVSFVLEVKLHAPLSFARSLLSRCSVWWWFSFFSFCSKLVLRLQQHWDFVELLFSAASSTFSSRWGLWPDVSPRTLLARFIEVWSVLRILNWWEFVGTQMPAAREKSALVGSHSFIDLGLETWAQCVSGPRIEAC